MNNSIKYNYAVAIIGSGPAGISSAITLKKAGINNIVIIERESSAGGVPRHCGHPPFGLWEYKKVLTGPKYAELNASRIKELEIELMLNTTVTKIGENGRLSLISSSNAVFNIKAQRVIIATGSREKPRSSRFISGNRCLGIYNTGTLQAYTYLHNKLPFSKPVIIGSEIVSFSALLTCRKFNIKPVAMIECKPKTHVRFPINLSIKLFNVKLYLETEIVKLIGKTRIQSIVLKTKNGKEFSLACDGVLFSGQFVPESGLILNSHLKFNRRFSPITNKFGMCSDSAYYAVGNVIQQPAEESRNPWFYSKNNAPNSINMSGTCWNQGVKVAHHISKNLN